MQLFITPYIQTNNIISLTEERVVHQLSKVLRAKVGDEVAVQWEGRRVVIKIIDISKSAIEAEVVTEERLELDKASNCLAVAMPNKFDKAELIVQKCAEAGVDTIVFFPAQHSIIKEMSEKKMERLQKISLEAVEQSRWKKIPNLFFEKNVFLWSEWKEIFVAHQDGEDVKKLMTQREKNENSNDVIVLVWPEGWRHEDEEKMFEKNNVKKISFGENILRMETAAIIGWRLIKNW